jgi:hypothetical protein
MGDRAKPLYLTGFAGFLRRIADRIDDKGAPRRMSAYSFTFERGEGIRFRDDHKGCPLWYLGEDDYQRAHAEADKPAPRIDWAALAKGAGERHE